MNAAPFAGMLLACFAVCLTAPDSSASGLSSEVAGMEKLAGMHCQVDVNLSSNGTVTERVDASGRIAPNHQDLEPVTDTLFRELERLRSLTSLRLDLPAIADANATKRLALLRTVRELELLGRGPKDHVSTVLPYVSCLTNIESLCLLNISMNASDLAQLSALKKLKRFDLSTYTKLDSLAVGAIAKLPSLESLAITGECEKGALAALSNCTNLTTLSLAGPDMNVMLSGTEALNALKRLEINEANLDVPTAKKLLELKGLQSLRLRCCHVAPGAAPILASLKLRRFECLGMGGQVVKELAGEVIGQWDLKASR